MRARRKGWEIALFGVVVAAPALDASAQPAARPAEPAPRAGEQAPRAGEVGPRPGEPVPKPGPSPPAKYRPYVDRSNYIPAPYALGVLGLATNVHIGRPAQAELSLGFAVGLTSRIWLDGSFGTLRWAPSLVFHSAQIGPNALLVDTPGFELDAMLHVSGPADDGRIVEQVEPALYAVIHVEHALRVDLNPAFDVNPGPTTTYGFRLPAAFAFQLGDHVYASINTGVTLANFGDPRESTAIPAGLSFGWSDSVGPKRLPAMAILPTISFPYLVKPWANEPFRPDVFSVGILWEYVWKY